MSRGFTDGLPDFDSDDLLNDAVAEILTHENSDKFFAWLHRSMATYFSFEGPYLDDVQPLNSMVTTLGRAIWNATPLPSNNFTPHPLPEPSGDSPCPCASGRKYKHCCAPFTQSLDVDSQALWPLVLNHLSEKQRRLAIKMNKVPIEAITYLAQDYLENGKPRKGVALLEPLLEGTIHTPDDASITP